MRGPIGGSTGSQLRRLQEDYNQATRLLRRQARRGNARSALDLIKLREEATEKGIQTGGIRNKEAYDAGILDRVDQMNRGADERAKATELTRQQAEEERQRIDGGSNPETPVTDPRTESDVFGRMRGGLSGMATGLAGKAALGIAPQDLTLGATPALGAAPEIGTQDSAELSLGIDGGLGTARTPQEIALLRQRRATSADLARKPNWWERNRKI